MLDALVGSVVLIVVGLLWLDRLTDRGIVPFSGAAASVAPFVLAGGIASAGIVASRAGIGADHCAIEQRFDERFRRGAPKLRSPVIGVAWFSWGATLIVVSNWDSGALPVVAAAAWLCSMGAVLVATRPTSDLDSTHRSLAAARTTWWRAASQWVPELCVVVIALALRIAALNRYPYIVDGDGAALALSARDVGGKLTDPFTTGYLDHPTMFAFVQRSVMWLVRSDGLAGARVASGLAGTGAVIATYLLARTIAGRRVGLVSAALLATMPLHIAYSRIALNNVFDSLFLPVVLLLIDRAFAGGRWFEAAAAGLCVGIAQYFYFGSRLLVPVAVVFVGFHMWKAVTRGERRATIAELTGWIAVGFVVAYTPLGLHYLAEPQDFSARWNAVSFTGPYLDAKRMSTGQTAAELIVRQIARTLTLPFSAPKIHFGYSPPTPLVGWALAVPTAIGLGAVTTKPLTRRHFPLAVCWWGSLLVISMTVTPSSGRWVIACPIAAIVAAIGLETVAAVCVPAAARLTHVGVSSRRAVLAAATAVIAIVSVIGHFAAIEDLDTNGDFNSLVATELGHQLASGELGPPGVEVVAAFPPQMGLRSHATVELLAPNATGFDIDHPMLSERDVPTITGPTVFVFLAGRVHELDVVRTRYPTGTATLVDRYGVTLYTAYVVEP